MYSCFGILNSINWGKPKETSFADILNELLCDWLFATFYSSYAGIYKFELELYCCNWLGLSDFTFTNPGLWAWPLSKG